jgi:hypothetical protein
MSSRTCFGIQRPAQPRRPPRHLSHVIPNLFRDSAASAAAPTSETPLSCHPELVSGFSGRRSHADLRYTSLMSSRTCFGIQRPAQPRRPSRHLSHVIPSSSRDSFALNHAPDLSTGASSASRTLSCRERAWVRGLSWLAPACSKGQPETLPHPRHKVRPALACARPLQYGPQAAEW